MDHSKNQHPTLEEAVKAISEQNDDDSMGSLEQVLEKTAKDDTDNVTL